MDYTNMDLEEVISDNKYVKITDTTCNENMMSQKSTDFNHSELRGIECQEHTYDNGDYNENYYGNWEQKNGEYFEGYCNYNDENGDYYQGYDEYYEDGYYGYSYYGDGVDEIIFTTIKGILHDLIRATVRKEEVVEDAQTYLVSILGVCSINQRQQLMEIKVEGDTPLATCCEIGNLALAKFLVENCNADVNGLPILWAIYKSNTELFHYLMGQNADVGTCLDNRYSLLMCAVGIMPDDHIFYADHDNELKDLKNLRFPARYLFGYTFPEPNMDIVKTLLEHGIVKKISDLNIFRCLENCIKKSELFNLIVDAIEDVDTIRDEKGCSILGLAIKMSKLKAVEKLVSKGADINNIQLLKCIKYKERDSQTIHSIVNSRWLSLIDPDKSNGDLIRDDQGYVHPVLYCASIEDDDFHGLGGGLNNLDMVIYLMQLPQIDPYLRLDAMEILGAYYTLKGLVDWTKLYQIALKCWKLVTGMRQKVHTCMCTGDLGILDMETGDEKDMSLGENTDEKKEKNKECDDMHSDVDTTVSSKAGISHNDGKSAVEINNSDVHRPIDTSHSSISISSPSETSKSKSSVLSPTEISHSNCLESDKDEIGELNDLNSNTSSQAYINRFKTGNFPKSTDRTDVELRAVQDLVSISKNQGKKMYPKNINNQPRAVFKNKLELCTQEELDKLKPEDRVEIATQSALLFERLVGYDSPSTLRSFIQLAKMYRQYGDKQQYVTIMIYILVYFNVQSSSINRYENVLRNLAFMVTGKNSNSYQLDISTQIIITKLFFMTNICEGRCPDREFSFLLSAIDKLRMYEKTDDELHDFNGLIRVLVKLDRRNRFGQSLLHYAALLKKRKSIDEGYLIDHYDTDEEIDNGWDMSCDDWMFLAFHGGSLLLTNFFLRCGVDPNTHDKEGMTPLHAIYKVLPEGESLSSESMEIVESLTEAGGHFDCVDAFGKTAIDYSQNTASPLCPVGSRSLQCIASSVIVENNIDYQGHIPKNLVEFVQLHGKRGTLPEKPKNIYYHDNKYKCMYVM